MAVEITSPPPALSVAPRDDWSERAAIPVEDRGGLDIDRPLGMLAVGLRWLGVSVGAVAAAQHGIHDLPLLCASISLVTFAVWQTIQRPRLDPPDRTLPYLVIIELLLTTIAVAVTGGLGSPLVLTPAIAIVLAGYTFSDRQVMALAYGALAAIAVLAFLGHVPTATSQSLSLLGAMYVLCGALGAFTRRLTIDSARRHAESVDQVARMTRANELLVALHGVAQTLPASLDLTEVVASARARLRAMFDVTVMALLVRDPASGRWHAELAEGVRISGDFGTADLPTPLLAALGAPHPRRINDHIADRARGVSPFARSGLYVALRSRGNLVGALAVEHDRPDSFTDADVELMESIAGPIALAVDNALLFARLRILGAETERARIARDLHDRIAQSLVYVTFELERLSKPDARPDHDALVDLHGVVHTMVSELRDTLADLRATVSETDDLATVATRQLERLSERYGFEIEFMPRLRATLPVTVEQELWRILQEAIHNAARHAHAKRVEVRYEVSHSHALLEIRDDGVGFDPSAVVGDHYGVVGMQERAAAIGAVFTIKSTPGRGTAVRVEMETVK